MLMKLKLNAFNFIKLLNIACMYFKHISLSRDIMSRLKNLFERTLIISILEACRAILIAKYI